MAIVIKLQTSTVELEVKAIDGANESAKIKVGYRRYKSEQAEQKQNELRDLATNPDTTREQLDVFIKENIAYLKDVEIFDENEATGEVKLVTKVQDTRKVKQNDDLWGEASNACSYLLELLLSSDPWRLSLMKKLHEALYNIKLDEKN